MVTKGATALTFRIYEKNSQQKAIFCWANKKNNNKMLENESVYVKISQVGETGELERRNYGDVKCYANWQSSEAM